MAKISLYLDSRKANAEGKYPLAIHLFHQSMLIGSYKREHNVAIIQAGRWEQLLSDMIKKGKAMGLSETCVSTIMNAIHDESVRVQNRVLED